MTAYISCSLTYEGSHWPKRNLVMQVMSPRSDMFSLLLFNMVNNKLSHLFLLSGSLFLFPDTECAVKEERLQHIQTATIISSFEMSHHSNKTDVIKSHLIRFHTCRLTLKGAIQNWYIIILL